MKKNEIYTDVVIDLGMNGEGIIKRDGYTVFLPFAITNEKVTYTILKVKESDKIAFAKLVEVDAPADERVRAKCKVFTKCGGCKLQHLKYTSQLRYKTKKVQDCIKKIAKIDIAVQPCIKSENEYNYRNKLQLPVGKNAQGENVIGFYAENSHRIVNTDSCPIHPVWADRIIEIFRDFMDKCGIEGYDENNFDAQTIALRHIVVREIKGAIMIVAVVTSNEINGIDSLLNSLSNVFDKYTLYLNVNRKRTNVVFGSEFILVSGEEKFIAKENDVKFEAGPLTFLQTNNDVKKKLYDRVVKSSGIDEETVVIDAYSGAGIMTAMTAKYSKYSYGIECVKEAVECANDLIRLNGLEGKMENVLGNCEDVLPSLIEKIKTENSKCVIILDPPRKGCDRAVIEAVKNSGADKILYVSCNPATLGRDLGLLLGSLIETDGKIVDNKEFDLAKANYEILSVQPYDMFAQTSAVEVLCVLNKK